MKIEVREMMSRDVEKVVDYFLDSDVIFLKGMGAEKSKLPSREDWLRRIQKDLLRPFTEREFYYIIWLLDDRPVGHSNVNHIEYGKSATMHLHLWEQNTRKRGLGFKFVKLTIPYYFQNLAIKKLVCEPYAKNIAPNKTLKKLGFDFVRSYETVPGWINFLQIVNRYELTKDRFEKMFDV